MRKHIEVLMEILEFPNTLSEEKAIQRKSTLSWAIEELGKPRMDENIVKYILLNIAYDGVNVVDVNILKEPSYLGCKVLKLNDSGVKYIATAICKEFGGKE